MQVVEKEYSSHAKPALSFTCGFEKDCISLKIPKEGLEHGGWKITPYYDAEVSSQTSLVASLHIRSAILQSTADHEAGGILLLSWKKDPKL